MSKGTAPKHFRQKNKKKILNPNWFEEEGKKKHGTKYVFNRNAGLMADNTNTRTYIDTLIIVLLAVEQAVSSLFVQTLKISSQSNVIIALITFDTVSCCSLAVCIFFSLLFFSSRFLAVFFFFILVRHFFCCCCLVVILWMHFHLARSVNAKDASRCENVMSKFN